jgi:hypothetical protein
MLRLVFSGERVKGVAMPSFRHEVCRWCSQYFSLTL